VETPERVGGTEVEGAETDATRQIENSGAYFTKRGRQNGIQAGKNVVALLHAQTFI
jgi:hypothetical protein